MSPWYHVTGWLLFALVLVGAAYDLTVYLAVGNHVTISRWVYFTSKSYPVLPAVLGLTVGHLLLPQTDDPDSWYYSARNAVIVALFAVLARRVWPQNVKRAERPGEPDR